ncbi:O-antigen translocase [Enterobacter asburiae]|uniref:O-antigen translocase n=1 Tax=Enterobacter asburiae TaxID=61645 RepID=UPI0021CF84CA|nr:O-antigen translocase [Enterobacter asburiae]MCU6242990.1 O-antigen translocase [Enterobacter asburiae]
MKKILKITSMSAFLTLFKMLIGFVISKAAAVYAGPAGVVVLGQMQSLIASVMGILNAPVSTGVIKYTSENGEKNSFWWWRSSLVILCSISVPIVFCMIIYSESISYHALGSSEYKWLIIITSFTLPLAAIGTLITSIFNGLELYRKYLISGALSTIITFFIMLFLILKYKIHGVLIATGIQGGLSGIVLVAVAINSQWCRLSNFIGKVNKKQLKNISKFFVMTAISAMLFPATILIVRSIITNTVGLQSAGNWQAVWRISEAYLAVITMALSTYYLPKLAKINGYHNIKAEVHYVLKFILPTIVLMATFVFFCRDLLISILFTKDFSLARDLFLVQLIGDVIKIISWLYAYPVLAHGKAKVYIITELMFSLLLVGLTYLFVHRFGVHGANYAFALNYILYLICMRVILKKITFDEGESKA